MIRNRSLITLIVAVSKRVALKMESPGVCHDFGSLAGKQNRKRTIGRSDVVGSASREVPVRTEPHPSLELRPAAVRK
jgi:hypothetical protein